MRFLLALILILPVLAQQPGQAAKPDEKPQAAAPAKPDQKPADQKAADQKEVQPPVAAPASSAAAASPAPATEQWFTGNIEFGYRWVTGPGGSVPEYRSVVNLNQGPQLFGADFTILDPKKRAFDRLTASAYGWGSQPYNTASLYATKQSLYRVWFDYRNMAYFAAEPSFANPGGAGWFDQQSFDTRRRVMSFDIDLFPGKQIIPYLAFDRNSWQGNGIETWALGSLNSFPVPLGVRDATNSYRGGVRFEYNRWHVTLEQGGTTYKDDNSSSYDGSTIGNRTTPFLGQTLALNSLQQAYGIRGSSVYTKVLGTVRATSRLDVYGQFLYSRPQTDVSYTELAGGNFALAQSLLFYGAQYGLAAGNAVQPTITGNAGFELRPWKRVRVVESLLVNRQQDSSYGLFSALYLQSLTNPTQLGAATALLNPYQEVNYTQNQVDLFYDVTPRFTLRGGYRYLTGDATVMAGQLSQTGQFVDGKLRRNVAIAGVYYRPSQKLSLHGEYEGSFERQHLLPDQPEQLHQAAGGRKISAKSVAGCAGELQLPEEQQSGARYPLRFRQPEYRAFGLLDPEQQQVGVGCGGVRPRDDQLGYQLPGSSVPDIGGIHLPRARAHGAGHGGHQPPGHQGWEADRRGIVVHLFRQPPDEFLPAAGTPQPAAAKTRILELRVAVVRFF